MNHVVINALQTNLRKRKNSNLVSRPKGKGTASGRQYLQAYAKVFTGQMESLIAKHHPSDGAEWKGQCSTDRSQSLSPLNHLFPK